MRFNLPSFLIALFLALTSVLFSCDRDLLSTADQPSVDYVLIVTDSLTGEPLADVQVRVKTISGDTSTYYTVSPDGRAELTTVSSSRTLFRLSREGYRTLDFQDTVNSKPDTVFNLPVQRLLQVEMVSSDPYPERDQVQLLLRDNDFQRLRKGKASYIDQRGNDRIATDHDSDGTITLRGLAIGVTRVKLEHSGYLGQWMDLTLETDTARQPLSTTIVLHDLGYSLAGQVYAKTATGSKALLDAKVEFHLKDSSAYPRVFRTYTDANVGQNGRFLFAEVPALEGELWFFKDRTSSERIRVLPVTREEVMQDGPLPLVVLVIPGDSLLPMLVSGPGKGLPGNDSLGAKDSLVFRFNQSVRESKSIRVNLINSSELLIDTRWSPDGKVLTIRPRNDDWVEGKHYEYGLVVLDSAGEVFTVPGDSSQGIRGRFTVKMKANTQDTVLILPKNIRFAYFNSGTHYQFGPSDVHTSVKADSTSEFARLKWSWDASPGAGSRRPDSLVVYYRDNQNQSSWVRWGAIPGFLDSANLVFSDFYTTVQMASQKARFPLRDSGGAITFRVIPKDEGRLIDNRDTILEPVLQGMGPTVYVRYDASNAKDSAGVKDTVKVTFRRQANDPGTIMDWGSQPPIPEIVDDNQVTNTLVWEWNPNGREGYIIYTLPTLVTRAPRLRANLNGKLFLGKPIWQKNVNDAAVIE